MPPAKSLEDKSGRTTSESFAARSSIEPRLRGILLPAPLTPATIHSSGDSSADLRSGILSPDWPVAGDQTLQVRLVWLGDVGAGQERGVGVAGLYEEVALLAQFGEVIAQEGLYFMGVNDVADVGFDSFQRLQTRLKMIFHFEEFEAGAGLDYFGDLTFAHREDNRFDLRRQFAFLEGAEAAAGFRGAAFGIKTGDLAKIVAVKDAGAQALDFAAHGGEFFRFLSVGTERNFRERHALRQREFLRVGVVILFYFVLGNFHVGADFATHNFFLEQAVLLAHFVEAFVQVRFDIDAHVFGALHHQRFVNHAAQ